MKTPNTSATLAAMLLLAGNSLSANNSTDTNPVPVNIPDPIFKAALLNHSPVIDIDGNDTISIAEANAFNGKLDIHNPDKDISGITDITGLEAFTNIVELDCSGNNIKSLNLYYSTELTTLDCSSSNMSTLRVSNNTKLTNLKCDNNKLTSLNLTNNTLLTHLSCSSNLLTELNISQNINLTEIKCAYNALTSLDLSASTALTTLDCVSNDIATLDLSGSEYLTSLDCAANEITTLDLTENKFLINLDCSRNQINELNLNVNRDLQQVTCAFNSLEILDFSNNTNLKYLNCENNSLVSLNLANGKNTELADFTAEINPDLTCIKIDEDFTPHPFKWFVDESASYSSACNVITYNSSTVALPVEFTSFEAYLNEDVVELDWTTASEFENNFFAVERSTDGINYETIDEVLGAGTTTLAQYYTSEDTNPKVGVNYYRLKQVDFDGAFEYSDVIAIRYEGNDLVDVFPNPNYGETLYIKSAQHSDQLVDFQITNLQGQVIIAGQTEFSYGEAKIDLSSIPYSNVSTYFLTIMSEEQTPIIKKINIIRN